VEAKYSAGDVSQSLIYFKERLKPRFNLQIVRKPERFKGAFMSKGILLAPAAQALAMM